MCSTRLSQSADEYSPPGTPAAKWQWARSQFFSSSTLQRETPFPFFFKETATTEIYTLSLHDALPIFHLNYRGDDGFLETRRLHDQRVTGGRQLRKLESSVLITDRPQLGVGCGVLESH